MNIFVLDRDPIQAAKDQCDKHLVKMILEYGQMLSTAHRLLDGELVTGFDHQQRVKPKKFWLFDGETPEVQEFIDPEKGKIYKWVVPNAIMYQVAHAQHPCSVWARANQNNYRWLFDLFEATLTEYTRRYRKTHSAARLVPHLFPRPKNIPWGNLTDFAQAMPEEYKHEDAVEAYRRFYVGEKARFARWTDTPVPTWFINRLEGQDATHFQRTSRVD
jgi:hypothetical protein